MIKILPARGGCPARIEMVLKIPQGAVVALVETNWWDTDRGFTQDKSFRIQIHEVLSEDNVHEVTDSEIAEECSYLCGKACVFRYEKTMISSELAKGSEHVFACMEAFAKEVLS